MQYTQFLIFESCRECNLAKHHSPACPSGAPDRYGQLPTSQPLSDAQILGASLQAYELGFRGLIGWHYYNEPTMDWPRIKHLTELIRSHNSSARFVLWTNGTNLPSDADLQEYVNMLWITNYVDIHTRANRTFSHLHHLGLQRVSIFGGSLDNRNRNLVHLSHTRCLRPFNELIFDYYGNAHLCCIDIRGEIHLGSLHRESLTTIASRFIAIRDQVARHPMPESSPRFCLTCAHRMTSIGDLDPTIAKEARSYIDSR